MGFIFLVLLFFGKLNHNLHICSTSWWIVLNEFKNIIWYKLLNLTECKVLRWLSISKMLSISKGSLSFVGKFWLKTWIFHPPGSSFWSQLHHKQHLGYSSTTLNPFSKLSNLNSITMKRSLFSSISTKTIRELFQIPGSSICFYRPLEKDWKRQC